HDDGRHPEDCLMDIATLVGLILAIVGIIGGNVIGSGNPASPLNIPGFLIFVLGSLSATMISQSLARFIVIPKGLMTAVTGAGAHHGAQTSERLAQMAEQARRERLLALESDVEKIHDPFPRKGVQLMIDGTDPELLRQIMEIDAESMKHRAEGEAAVF